MRRRHHGIRALLPDPYVKGKVVERKFVQDNSGYNANFEDPRDWDNPEKDRGTAIRGLYDCQEIDEIWFTTKSRMTDYKYRLANDTYLNWLGDSQEEVDEWNTQFGKNPSQNLTVDEVVQSLGGRSFLREGVWDWQTKNGGNQNHKWDVMYKNTNPDIGLHDALTAPPIEELKDEQRGMNHDPNHLLRLDSNVSGIVELQKPGVIENVIMTYATKGQFDFLVTYIDNTSDRITVNAEIGRHKYPVNITYTKPIKKLFLAINTGTIKIDKSKAQEGIGKVFVKEAWVDPVWVDWSFGLGIEVRNHQEWLPEPPGSWKVIDLPEVHQLMGQAPRESSEPFQNIMDFIGGNAKNDPKIPFNLPHDNFKNTSGFSLYSTGAKGGGASDKVHSFGQFSVLHVGEWYDWISVPNLHKRLSFIPGSFDNRSRYIRLDGGIKDGVVQSAQVRYCKHKTPEELGYKLYVDDANDNVLMLKYPLSASNAELVKDLKELEIGLERGITLRYTNRKHMKVLRKWSEIKAEAEEINSQILVR